MSATVESARILVVDDVPDQVDSMRILLRMWGYEVQTTSGAVLALEAVPEFHPDLILLDRSMPKMDGDALAQALRGGMGESCPLLVAVSGWPSHHRVPVPGLFDAYLLKPVEPELLHQVIQATLEKRGRAPLHGTDE